MPCPRTACAAGRGVIRSAGHFLSRRMGILGFALTILLALDTLSKMFQASGSSGGRKIESHRDATPEAKAWTNTHRTAFISRLPPLPFPSSRSAVLIFPSCTASLPERR
jgi:hypothetical protein